MVVQICCWWWAQERTLFQVLDDVEPLPRDPLAPFRMSVIDRYKDMGTIAMGKSEAGLVRKGDRLFVMPNKCVRHCRTHAAVMMMSTKAPAPAACHVGALPLPLSADPCPTLALSNASNSTDWHCGLEGAHRTLWRNLVHA